MKAVTGADTIVYAQGTEASDLPDYQLMYHMLFNHITDTIESLMAIQRQAEALYINSPDPALTLLPGAALPEEE